MSDRVPRVVSGTAPHAPTRKSRVEVERMVGCGLSTSEIAYVLGCQDAEVKAHYADELANGAAAVTAKVGGALLKQAMRGDVAAARFWLQSRSRWTTPTNVELTGKDGAPIEVSDRRALIDGIVALVAQQQAQGQQQATVEAQLAPAVKPH